MRYLIVLSDLDPVARAVAERLGAGESTGLFVDGTPIRRGPAEVGTLRRSVRHIHDEALDERLPHDLASELACLVFPSIHRSESGQPCFTVHPLGNLGDTAEVGGTPGRLTPSAPRWMTDALRRLSEGGRPLGLAATFEATHHGPLLGRPAFFAEIGYGASEEAPAAAVEVLASVLTDLSPEAQDHVAVGVGGGHYVPHLTDLALKRRWSFGHLLSRHALERTRPSIVAEALRLTPEAEGIVFARAADATHPSIGAAGPRLRETSAERR